MLLRATCLVTVAITAAWAAFAQTKPPGSEVVRVGVLTDLGGPASSLTGTGSIAAAELAVEDSKTALPGRQVELVSGDYQNKPDTGSAIARKWFDQDGVNVIADVANSAVALAVADVAREKDRLFLATSAATTALTGAHCLPTTIQWTYDTYMQIAAIVPPLVEAGGKSWYFVTPDYAYGHDAQAVAEVLVKRNGGTVVGSVQHPSSTVDFSSYLLSASSSSAQVTAIVSGGANSVDAVKQSQEFGLSEGGRKVATFLMPLNTVQALGLDAGQGMYVSESFYWNLDDTTRKWSRRFFDKTGKMPNMAQAGVYSSLMHYFQAVARLPGASASSGLAVAAEMKAGKIDDPLFGSGYVRADGRFVHDTYLFRVKAPSSSTGPWDLYDPIKRIAAEDAVRPLLPKCAFKVGGS